MKSQNTPAQDTIPVLLTFKQTITFAAEVNRLIEQGSIDEVFGNCLKSIVQDHLTGIVKGRKLPDEFIALAKTHVGPHGIIKIRDSFFQLLVMVKKDDTSTKHRWKLVQLHDEGYHVKGLSEL